MAKNRLTEKQVPRKSWTTITQEQMRAGERAAESWAVTRRCAAATLTRTKAELLKAAKDVSQVEMLLDLANGITEYLEWRKTETGLLETAQARLLWVSSEAHAGK